MSHQLNCARNSISCIDCISMVCSGTSEMWFTWPHSGIGPQAQPHLKCCVMISTFLIFSIAGDSAFRVHYSLVEVVVMASVSFDKK